MKEEQRGQLECPECGMDYPHKHRTIFQVMYAFRNLAGQIYSISPKREGNCTFPIVVAYPMPVPSREKYDEESEGNKNIVQEFLDARKS